MDAIKRDECAECGEPMRPDRVLCPRNSEHIGRISVEYIRVDLHQRAVVLDDPRLIETLASVIENRHGTLHGIGGTLREALALYKREGA